MQLNSLTSPNRNNEIRLNPLHKKKFSKAQPIASIKYKDNELIYSLYYSEEVQKQHCQISQFTMYSLFGINTSEMITINPIKFQSIETIVEVTLFIILQKRPPQILLIQHNELQDEIRKHFLLLNNNVNVNMEFKGHKLQLRPQINGQMFGKIGELTIVNFKKELHQRVQIIQDNHLIENFFQHTQSSKLKLKNLKVGGLKEQLELIARRVFGTRMLHPRVMKLLGIKHVKGILLYGPPGTGKTLIARQISKVLEVEPKIVNGPQIFNQFVGKSQQKMRELFADAQKQQQQKGLKSKLHCIIFDEIDAICKKRGSQTSSGVYDLIVNQLLTCIDGINALNNILVIGITNRKDLIDQAILRPGRLEVHIQVNIPDQEGRCEVLNIHTELMRTNNILEDSADMKEIAKLTKNYTGAQLQGVVKSGQSFALERWKKLPLQQQNREYCKIIQKDLLNGIKQINPQFGKDNNILESIIPKNKIEIQSYKEIKLRILYAIGNLGDGKHTFLIRGQPGIGKTVVAAECALSNDTSFTKIISSDRFIGLNEGQIMNEIVRIFQDAQRCTNSFIILDDILRLIDFIPLGPKYNSNILNLLINLIKKVLPPSKKKIIIATVTNQQQFQDLGLMRYFKHIFNMKKLNQEEIVKVLETKGYKNRQANTIANMIISSTVNEIIDLSNLQKGKDAQSWINCWKMLAAK